MNKVSAAAAPLTPPPYFPREASLLAYIFLANKETEESTCDQRKKENEN